MNEEIVILMADDGVILLEGLEYLIAKNDGGNNCE